MERVQRGLSLCCNGARITLQWCSRSHKIIKGRFESVACIAAQERRKSGLSWEGEWVSQALHVFTEQSKRNSCYFMRKYWKGRKKLAPLLPSLNLLYALFLCLPLHSFTTVGGRKRGQVASSDCWQTSHIQRWDTERNLSKPPRRIERGSHCPVPAKEISQKQPFRK